MSKHKHPPNRLRKAALMRTYGKRCAYCRLEFSRRNLTEDHVIPKSRGGTYVGNIVPACYPCNKEKGNSILPIANLQRLQLNYPHLTIPQTFLQNHGSTTAHPDDNHRSFSFLPHPAKTFSQPVGSKNAS